MLVDTLRITGKTDEALKLVELPLLKHMDESSLRFYYGVLLQTAPAATDSSKAGRELERVIMLGGPPMNRRHKVSQYLRPREYAGN